MIKPALSAHGMGIAKIPPKKADPFYFSAEWAELRAAALERDGHTCTVPGCGRRARFVDHIKARRWGGSDKLEQLRSLCETHDAEFKERPDGSRAEMPK